MVIFVAPQERVFLLLQTTIFLGSSVAEQLTVNQLVVGSNPTRGAKA